MKEPTVYREMTNLEVQRALALAKCTLPPCSMTRRFSKGLYDQIIKNKITERQANYLVVCCYRYRRQMPAHLVPESPPQGYETPSQFRQRMELQNVMAAKEATA